MIRLLFIALLWATGTQSVVAQEPMVRTELQEKDSILVGQQLHLTVDFLAPGFFTSAPEFPDLSMPNAIVTLPQQRAQNLVQTINGVQYSGIRQVYLLIPETTGDFSTPTKTIDIVYSTDGTPAKFQVTFPSVRFSVGAREGVDTALVAKKLEMTQQWNTPPGNLEVGDSTTRTIIVRAESTQSVLLPPITVAQIPGLRGYSKPPKLLDDNSGQTITATRTDTIVYVAEKSGHYTLPSIDYPWFDLDASKPAVAHLDPIQVSVHDTVATSKEDQVTKVSSKRPTFISVLPVIVFGVVCLVALALLVWKSWQKWNVQHRQSEQFLFAQLLQTLKGQDPNEISLALCHWLKKLGYASIREWREQIASEELAKQVDALQRITYDPEATSTYFDTDKFGSLLGKFRSLRLHSVLAHKPSHLPELNPF